MKAAQWIREWQFIVCGASEIFPWRRSPPNAQGHFSSWDTDYFQKRQLVVAA